MLVTYPLLVWRQRGTKGSLFMGQKDPYLWDKRVPIYGTKGILMGQRDAYGTKGILMGQRDPIYGTKGSYLWDKGILFMRQRDPIYGTKGSNIKHLLDPIYNDIKSARPQLRETS